MVLVPQTDCVLRKGTVALGLSRRGGSITYCSVDGQALFFPASDTTAPFPFANFMLAPFSNRIAGGAFTFRGQRYNIPANLADPRFPLPIHGFGWQAEWQIEQPSCDCAILTLEPSNPDWPAPFSIFQEVRLLADGYEHVVGISNCGDVPMPAGLGLHPYFPSGAVEMRTGCSAVWLTGEDGIPHDHQQVKAEPDWFAGAGFDCTYDWSSRSVQIMWPNHSVEIRADALFTQLVVYIPQGAQFFCVEPVSHPTNAINSGAGMTIVAPGERISGMVRFALTRSD